MSARLQKTDSRPPPCAGHGSARIAAMSLNPAEEQMVRERQAANLKQNQDDSVMENYPTGAGPCPRPRRRQIHQGRYTGRLWTLAVSSVISNTMFENTPPGRHWLPSALAGDFPLMTIAVPPALCMNSPC